jgi:hypothetical protein
MFNVKVVSHHEYLPLLVEPSQSLFGLSFLGVKHKLQVVVVQVIEAFNSFRVHSKRVKNTESIEGVFELHVYAGKLSSCLVQTIVK